MPRDGSGVYSTPPGTHGTPNTTILSANYNSNVDDVAADLNTPRPIVAGGTGATTAAGALTALGAAPLASPVFTGDPQAPTPAAGDNDTSIATTAFVGSAITAAGTKRNYIINGAMMISQENGTTAGSINAYWPVDQFELIFSNAGTQTAQQTVNPTPGGSPNRVRITATVADASVASNDFCFLRQSIEGLRAAGLRLGSAAAKIITLQFGVRAPAGTYCISLQNGSGVRCYVAEYVIAPGEANTDVVKSVTIALDQTGIWATDNTTGLGINWMLMMGSSQQTTANSWVGGNFLATANQFNFMGTAGNVFELFDVSFTEGAVAPAFQVPDYASELALCQRYYQPGRMTFGLFIAATSFYCNYQIAPVMRAQPTILVKSTANVINASAAFSISAAAYLVADPGASSGWINFTTTTSQTVNVTGVCYYGTIAFNARL